MKFAHHGQLGKGVYVARHEKAYRFAENGAWHDGDEGGLIKVLVNIQNPKYVSEVQRAGHWWDEGYDACRVDSTPLSSNMEWCIRDPAQIRVLSISRVRVTSSPGAEAPPPMIIYDDDADDDNEESDEAEEGEAQHLEERAPSPQEERAPSPQSPSIGERLAGFGGDVEQLTDYHQGLIDSDGEPTEYATETGYERRDDDDDEDDDGDDESDDHGDDYSVRIGGLVEVGGDDDSEDDDIDGHDDDGEDDGGDDDSDGHDDNGDDDDGDADGHDDAKMMTEMTTVTVMTAAATTTTVAMTTAGTMTTAMTTAAAIPMVVVVATRTTAVAILMMVAAAITLLTDAHCPLRVFCSAPTGHSRPNSTRAWTRGRLGNLLVH